MEINFRVSGRIAKPVEEVFEAVADPAQLSQYFTTGGAKGRLETGATVVWDFHDFPGAFPVEVIEVVPNNPAWDWSLFFVAGQLQPTGGLALGTAGLGFGIQLNFFLASQPFFLVGSPISPIGPSVLPPFGSTLAFTVPSFPGTSVLLQGLIINPGTGNPVTTDMHEIRMK